MKKPTFKGLPKAISKLSKKLESIEKLLLEQSNKQSKKEEEKLLTVQETAKFLNLSVPTIYSKVSKGELPVMKRSKRLYFSNIELMAYLKKGRNKTNTEIEQEANNYLSNRG